MLKQEIEQIWVDEVLFFFFFLSFSLNRKTDASQAYRKVGTFISSIL